MFSKLDRDEAAILYAQLTMINRILANSPTLETLFDNVAKEAQELIKKIDQIKLDGYARQN